MSAIKITIDKFLVIMETAINVLIYEYYDGLQISIDDEKVEYLIETEEYRSEQFQIFEKLKTLQTLVEFKYTTRFGTEIEYETLQVPGSLKRLSISHMEKIKDVKQLGNIEYLYLEDIAGFKVNWLNLLPKTLKKIDISSLDIENQDEFNKIIEYFNAHDIEYYIDDYCNYSAEN